MAINQNTKGRAHVATLIVGASTSAGGRGASPTPVRRIVGASVTVNPGASIDANTTFESAGITVTGVRVGDVVTVVPPVAIEASLIWAAYVSANDAVKVRIANPTAGPISTTSRTWTLLWLQLVA